MQTNLSYWFIESFRGLKVFGLLAMFVVFLNVTNLYTFLSGLTGVPFQIYGKLMLGVMALYVLCHHRHLRLLLQNPFVFFYLFFFVLLPIVSVLWSPYALMRFAGYNLLSGLIFVTCCIWIMKEGWLRFSQLVLLSWAVAVFGVILSYFVPDVFNSTAFVKAEAGGDLGVWDTVMTATAAQARAFGFYLQPNRAYTAMLLHLLILLPVYLHDKPKIRIIILSVTMGCFLLTGSRGALVLYLFFVGMIVLSELVYGVRIRGRLHSGAVMLPRYALLGLLAVLFIFGASLSVKTNESGLSAIGRVAQTFTGGISDFAHDESIAARIELHKIYFSLIAEAPVFGHGAGAAYYYQYMGSLPNVSHNNILERAFNVGVPAALATYGFFVVLCFRRESKRFTEYFRYNLSILITVYLFVASFTISTLFSYRVFPILMAFWLMLLFFPQGVKNLNKTNVNL